MNEDPLAQAVADFRADAETLEETPEETSDAPITGQELRAAARAIRPQLDLTLEASLVDDLQGKRHFCIAPERFSKVDCAYCPWASWAEETTSIPSPAVVDEDGGVVGSELKPLSAISCVCSGGARRGQTTFCIAPALEKADGKLEAYPVAQQLGVRETTAMRCGDYLLAVEEAEDVDLSEVVRQRRKELKGVR